MEPGTTATNTATRSDLRRSPRVAVAVECHLEGASGRGSIRLSDLSVSGCYVDTRIPFRAGAAVTLTAVLDGVEIAFTGRVVHAEAGFGFGCLFDQDSLTDSARQRLDHFLRSRS